MNLFSPAVFSKLLGLNPRRRRFFPPVDETRSLAGFLAEFSDSRPDLADVRNYNRQMIDILGTLRGLAGAALLDVGASPHGFALERALEAGVQYYCGIGLGVSRNIEIRGNSAHGHLLRMNAEKMDLPPATFDLIISLSTFEHFFNPDRALEEMHRVLRPGGAALISFQPIWTSARGHHLHHISDVNQLIPPWAHLYWSPEQMRDELSRSWPPNASMSLEQVIEWIYRSDEINRIDIKRLRRYFAASPLTVEWLTPLDDELTDEERATAADISEKVRYEAADLQIKGFSAFLIRT
jgi:SAM-dependent methyltransferase